MISVVKRFGGIEVSCCGARILVDPTRNFPSSLYDAVLITHGHSDHYTRHISKAKRVVMSSETLRVLRDYRGISLGANVTEAKVNVPIVFDNFSVIPLNAGHVMGSLMYLIEFREGSLLVTGDFNVEDSLILEGAKPYPDVDILVVEATYGDPSFNFRPRDEVYGELLEMVDKADGVKVALSGFALGKGQELYALFSRNGYDTYMDPSVFRLNRILLGNVRRSREGDVAILDMPPRVRLSGEWVLGVVTGGAPLRAVNSRLHIQLSNHSDFKGLLEFTLGTRARRIYTVYGYASTFAKYLRSRYGLSAYTIPERTLI